MADPHVESIRTNDAENVTNDAKNVTNYAENATNSPSRLPAPKAKKTEIALLAEDQFKKRKVATPGNSLLSSVATAGVRTYRTTATTTAKPATTRPTKPVMISNGTKRPAWDMKGRLEDMEVLTQTLNEKFVSSNETVVALHAQLQASAERVNELENFRRGLETKVVSTEKENSQIAVELREARLQLQAEINSRETGMSKIREKHQIEMDLLARQRDSIREQLEHTNAQLSIERAENTSLKTAISRNSSTLVELESQTKALRAKIDLLEDEGKAKQAAIESTSERLALANKLIAELEQKVQDGERLRRKLHNSVQELKGNIRVFCRVRPLFPSEMTRPDARMADEMVHIVFGRGSEDQEELQLIQKSETATGNPVSKSFPFVFDKVFGPQSSQDQVFEEISQLVQSALDGYRVCIFAYGQTGSGKTFTMEGPPSKESAHVGMIPRAVEQIFSTATSLVQKGWKFAFEASYLEIYNETIRDLLASSPSSDEGPKHEIKHVNGSTCVTDLSVVSVETPAAIMGLLAKASASRAVGETQCNDRSSRSHSSVISVFTLKLSGENTVTGEKIDGLLNLIDLAGSERLSQSGSTGERLKETQAINKSLSSLGDVIFALANKEAHVPFRNSKLTYLLQNALGGNCKTLMFVNVSPALSNFQESLCSLRFATKVNSCQIGTARRNATK